MKAKSPPSSRRNVSSWEISASSSFGLRVFVPQPEELEDERILDLLLGGDRVFGLGDGSPLEQRGLVSREGGALVELAVDLPFELSHGPSAAQRLPGRQPHEPRQVAVLTLPQPA